MSKKTETVNAMIAARLLKAGVIIESFSIENHYDETADDGWIVTRGNGRATFVIEIYDPSRDKKNDQHN